MLTEAALTSIDMSFDMDSAFEAVSKGLTPAGIDFLMVGGHAVNHYGYLRATQDVDFMIAAENVTAVRTIMTQAGFTNLSLHDTVAFFNRPGSPLRVDFLQVDRETMKNLLKHAVTITYFDTCAVKVPCLRDLIAMKLFALRTGGPKRRERDMPDIVHLVREHQLDLESDLKPLCDRFGTVELYRELCERITEREHA